MRRKVVNKLVVNWAASFLSVLLLMSMVALPALAAIAANSVNSSSIVDGSIQTRDIKRNAINSSRIRDYSIKKEDIHSGSINKYKLTSNAVNTFKIEDGSVKTQDIADGTITDADIAAGAAIGASKINRLGLDADTLDGKDSGDFADVGHGHDSTKTGYVSIPPSAFVPESQNNSFTQNNGFSLYTTAPGTQSFFAPIQLPQDAKVTKATFETLDNNTNFKITWTLKRREGATLGAMAGLATGTSSAIVGYQNLEDTTIFAGRAVVDNLNYSYFVEVELTGNSNQLAAGRVLIEYEYGSPGS